MSDRGERIPKGTFVEDTGAEVSVGVKLFDAWYTIRNVLFVLNELHIDFRWIFFEHFHTLLEEQNDEVYVCHLANYVRWILSQYMFIRVERPRGSKRFVLGYMKCEKVFSFGIRFEKMRLRLNRVPPTFLKMYESKENKTLRLLYVGETDYEWALETHRNDKNCPVLLHALAKMDEKAAEVLLNGGQDPNELGEDPNEIGGFVCNSLHMAAVTGCSIPLFDKILAKIVDVNQTARYGCTALMLAVSNNHLDIVISLMKHPMINLNIQDHSRATALHYAVGFNYSPDMVIQLMNDDRIDSNLKTKGRRFTPLRLAIDYGNDECVKLLRDLGVTE